MLKRKDYTTAAFISHRDFEAHLGWKRGFSVYGILEVFHRVLKDCSLCRYTIIFRRIKKYQERYMEP